MSRLDSMFLTGVSRFHEITGYSEIERLKMEVTKLETQIASARERVRASREAYDQRLANRASSQREMNELLLRKQTWQTNDLERFTELYKDDHRIEMDVNDAKSAYDEAEIRLEDLQLQSGRLIGARYREEQLWSDKIRQASTWGTWILMGINIALFVVVQLILEPWKRRRLVRSFEQQVRDMFESETRGARGIPDASAADPGKLAADAAADAAADTVRPPQEPELVWDTLPARLQQPELVLRPIEASALAAGGAAVVASLVLLLSRV